MKILYVTTISNTVNAFLIPHIKMLVDEGHQVDVAFNVNQKVDLEIIELGCNVHQLEFERSPINKRNYIAYKKLKQLIQNEKYDIVHTHTPVASACVRIACRKLKNVKVIYTAHGFHFYKGAPLINWFIYYSIEWLLARYTNVLLTINQEDYIRAVNLFKADKIEHIPGVGLDIEKFSNIPVEKEVKRKELGIPSEAFIILSVGELNENKNHKVIIKALSTLKNPNIYYVICGQGSLDNYLQNLVNHLGLKSQVKFLGFRSDVAEIYKSVDMFAFPSYREGLSVALMEAMASGLPIVCSNIRGNNDLVVNNKGGYLVEPNDIEGITMSISKIVGDPEIRIIMGFYNNKAIEKYTIQNVINELKRIYKDVV